MNPGFLRVVRHDADRERVTALIGQGNRAFRGILRHSEALSCLREPRRPVADAPPNGNQMATMFAPTRVIPEFEGTRVEEYRIGSILVRGLDPKTVQRLKAAGSRQRALASSRRFTLGGLIS